jgi:hypothetical protein
MKFAQQLISVLVFVMYSCMEQVRARIPWCLFNETQLRTAITNASKTNYTRFNICASTIQLGRALDVSGKRIHFSCRVRDGCTFDAQNRAGFLVGTNSHIKISGVNSGINFKRGKSVSVGGMIGMERAPIMFVNSVVEISRSSFSNSKMRYSGLFEVYGGASDISLDKVEFTRNIGSTRVSEYNSHAKQY